MSEVVLKVENVTKLFKQRVAVKNVSFEIKAGEIFGFLGPNGAGKTTTMRMICGLCKIDKGDIKICGFSVKKDFEKAVANLGGLIENPLMYTYLSGYDNLKYYARLQNKKINKDDIMRIAEIVGLQNRIKDKVKTYSLGMRQRLGIAQALLNNPKLLILDEPLSGLDPAGVVEIREFLKILAKDNNIAVMISSHMLAEMENLCDTLAVINNGEILEFKTMLELKEGLNAHRRIRIHVDYPNFAGKLAIYECNFKTEVIGDSILVEASQDDVPKLARTLLDHGLSIFGVDYINKNLEEIFMEIINTKNNGSTVIN